MPKHTHLKERRAVYDVQVSNEKNGNIPNIKDDRHFRRRRRLYQQQVSSFLFAGDYFSSGILFQINRIIQPRKIFH